ncbi:hypothetical protein GCM10009687_46500 [Asanoa iriomotensis]|uniref:LLM class flavin-dependent oxidoreductase n=1 Tax=Asanoa iriomotensis TaxID=234613 RepID=UPI0031E1C21E
MEYAVGLPTVGAFGDARALTHLAVAAEERGWDGVQLWDHLLYDEPGWPVASSTVAAATIAARTRRIRIILTVVLPRRQVQDVAQDTAAINALSGGRLTLLAIIGSMDREYADFGLDPDLRARGRALDDRLDQLTALWERWGADRAPIWCGGRWPRRKGLQRAARFDGAMPGFEGHWPPKAPPVDDVAAAVEFVRSRAGRPIDVAVEGAADTHAQVAPYAAAGITWWVEALGWWRGGLADADARVGQGPPQP